MKYKYFFEEQKKKRRKKQQTKVNAENTDTEYIPNC